MTEVHILNVFCEAQGNFGDRASVIVDEGRQISDSERQKLASDLATGETIFINDVQGTAISVMHPQGEIDFAGVGVLGAAWLLKQLRSEPTDIIHGRGGEITTWEDNDITWVRAEAKTLPAWNYEQLPKVEEIERLTVQGMKYAQHTMVWAWIDEAKGHIRARTFASDWDIPEAMGNGSGAMLLAKKLNKNIEIRHGRCAVIFANPAPQDCVDIGGRVVEGRSISLV